MPITLQVQNPFERLINLLFPLYSCNRKDAKVSVNIWKKTSRMLTRILVIMFAGKREYVAELSSLFHNWNASQAVIATKLWNSVTEAWGEGRFLVSSSISPELRYTTSYIIAKDHNSGLRKIRKPNHRLRKWIPGNHFEKIFSPWGWGRAACRRGRISPP